MEDKIYSLGGTALTDEQRASIRKIQEEQEQKTQELAKQQLESNRTKARATLEQLLKTKIAPEEDRIVVWADAVEVMTASGLWKPKEVTSKERPCSGTVIAVGPGKTIDNVHLEAQLAILEVLSPEGKEKAKALRSKLKTIPLVPGERILYGHFAGTAVPDPETKEELLIMRPSDIFAKFKS